MSESFTEYLGKTIEGDVSEMEKAFASFFSNKTSNVPAAAKTQVLDGLKASSKSGRGEYMTGALENLNVVDEFSEFINSTEQTLQNVSSDVLKTLRTNNVLKDFADQDLFKKNVITMGGKPIVTKDTAEKAHNILINKLKTNSNPEVQTIASDETLSTGKKYDKIQEVSKPGTDTSMMANIGKNLHFNFSYKRFFNFDNFPLLISCIVIFIIGYFVNQEMYQTAVPSFPMLKTNSIVYAFIGIAVASLVTTYYFKYDILTCLIFVFLLGTILLVAYQYDIMYNYNKIGQTVETQSLTPPGASDDDASAPTAPTASGICDPGGDFPPTCLINLSPTDYADLQQLEDSNNLRYIYVTTYLDNQRKNVLTYTYFLFIILGVYIFMYIVLFYFFPKYDRHLCYLVSMSVGLLYMAHYYTTGFVEQPNDRDSIDRFQNLNDTLNFLLGPNWQSVLVWFVVLLLICFVLLYWGAKNYTITSTNVWFNSIFLFMIILVISFSVVLYLQLKSQNVDNPPYPLQSVNVVDKNILYVLIVLIAFAVLFMAIIIRKIYKRNKNS